MLRIEIGSQIVTLQFICPKTSARLDTGVATTLENLAANWDRTLRIRCPHCKTEHVVKFHDAYAGAMRRRLEASGWAAFTPSQSPLQRAG